MKTYQIPHNLASHIAPANQNAPGAHSVSVFTAITTLTHHHEEVLAWLGGREARVPLALVENMGEVVGQSLTWDDVSRGAIAPRPVTAVRVVLRRRTELPGGFTVVTAYPTRATRPRPNAHRRYAQ